MTQAIIKFITFCFCINMLLETESQKFNNSDCFRGRDNGNVGAARSKMLIKNDGLNDIKTDELHEKSLLRELARMSLLNKYQTFLRRF